MEPTHSPAMLRASTTQKTGKKTSSGGMRLFGNRLKPQHIPTAMRMPKKPKKFDNVIHILLEFANENSDWHQYLKRDFDLIISTAISDLDIGKKRFFDLMQESPYWSTLFSYIFEQFATKPRDGDGYTFIDDYLAEHPRRETRTYRRYLEAINETPVLLWEIVDVKPNQHIMLRPYGSTDTPIQVATDPTTQPFHRWDCIAARVIQLDDTYLFSHVVLPIPIENAIYIHRARALFLEHVTQSIDASHQKGALEEPPKEIEDAIIAKTQEMLPVLLFKFWIEHLYEEMTATPPEIKNDDDESYQPAKVRFPLNSSGDQIATVLNGLPELVKIADKNNLSWGWTPDFATESAEQPARQIGTITLRKKALELKVDSRERAEKGELWLRNILQKQVKTAMIVYDNVEEMQAQLAEPPDEDLVVDEDVQDAVKAHMDNRYRSYLDQPCSFLKDQTPRSCINDPAMHPRLVEWLKTLENNTLKTPSLDYDFTWLWDELGLQHYR